jgi:hypothetical protein
MEQRALEAWDEADLDRLLPCFFGLPMVSSAKRETAGRLLQWLHRLVADHHGKADRPVGKVITGLIHNGGERLMQSIKDVRECAMLQPLDCPAIPYEEDMGVVRAP